MSDMAIILILGGLLLVQTVINHMQSLIVKRCIKLMNESQELTNKAIRLTDSYREIIEKTIAIKDNLHNKLNTASKSELHKPYHTKSPYERETD